MKTCWYLMREKKLLSRRFTWYTSGSCFRVRSTSKPQAAYSPGIFFAISSSLIFGNFWYLKGWPEFSLTVPLPSERLRKVTWCWNMFGSKLLFSKLFDSKNIITALPRLTDFPLLSVLLALDHKCSCWCKTFWIKKK